MMILQCIFTPNLRAKNQTYFSLFTRFKNCSKEAENAFQTVSVSMLSVEMSLGGKGKPLELLQNCFPISAFPKTDGKAKPLIYKEEKCFPLYPIYYVYSRGSLWKAPPPYITTSGHIDPPQSRGRR
jgi:hypothetical protein